MVLRVLNGHLDITVNEIMLQNKSLSRQQLFLGVPKKDWSHNFYKLVEKRKAIRIFFIKI